MTIKVWSWRMAIAKARLEPLTKVILYTLANYMNEHGGNCYPSLDTICAEACLARASVVKYLRRAEEAGFIRRSKHGFAGKAWARCDYTATFPKSMELATADDAAQTKETADPQHQMPIKNGGSRRELPSAEGSSPGDEGSSSHDNKAVHRVNLISPIDHSSNSPERAREPEKEKPIATALPYTSLPDDWKKWTQQQWRFVTDDRIADVWAGFSEYWTVTVKGRKALKTDWPRTWRNWSHKENFRPAWGTQNRSQLQSRPPQQPRAGVITL
jgi:hypothetical protein